MTPRLHCPRCDREVPADAPGALCLHCLLGVGLEPPLPRRFGRYELRRKIGSGGMGVIFEARELSPDRRVALKMIRSGELATAEEREWFRREAQDASRLEHRHIVPIFHVGAADEPAYYTMRLMTGGTLAGQRERLRGEPRRAAQLLAAVARAVHYGHARGTLHRDLKPANILLDAEGEPHVADFGIALRLAEEAGPQGTGLLGTPHYMSPEQAGPAPRQLTTKSDVYSLGAILFELLTGRPPFDGATSEAVLEQQRTALPPSPRSLAPHLERDLDAICLRCLEKSPELRPSAEQLADQLEGFLRGEAVAARPLGRWERGWRWARRHPAAAGFAATALLTLLTVAVAAVVVARAQEKERRQDVLEANAFAARSLAGLALFELCQTAHVVEKLAAEPAVLARLAEPPGRMPPEVEEVQRRESFATVAMRDTRGMAVARSPLPPVPGEYFGQWYGWTDHFKGAAWRGEQGRHEGFVARPSRSEVTGDFKFTVSAPVFAPEGGWRGVIYASFATDSVLGHQPVVDDHRRTTALLARPDHDRATEHAPLPTGFVVLVHDRLDHGTSLPVSSPALEGMPAPSPDDDQCTFSNVKSVLTDENYRDPVRGFEGRWLAGFAPVGDTGYAVVVQTRYSAIDGPPRLLLGWLLRWVGLPLLLAGLALNLLLFFFRRRPA